MAQQRSTDAHQRKREEVLDIVARLINVDGASNATLSALANVLGVKHNTLYYYFKDRNELHRTVLYRTLELRGQRRVGNAVAEGWFKPLPSSIVQPFFGSMLYKLGAGFLDRKGGVDCSQASIEITRLVYEGMGADRLG